MTVWDDVVGQPGAVSELRRAVEAAADLYAGGSGTGMTHAWLFTGPPGSGRSTAARAFAAALQCAAGGCGSCNACRTVLAGTHPDVQVVNTATLSIGKQEAVALVARGGRYPSSGGWQVILVEDADRLTDVAANVLLKAIEEPPRHTVWLLCAPALEDVIVTIRSRCRHVGLRTPPPVAVAELLMRRDGIDAAMAHFAARASQGHIGRARRLATDEQARLRRNEALRMPGVMGSMGDCLTAAANLVDAAAEESKGATTALDERETADLARVLGAGTTGRGMVTGAAGQLKELEKQQKLRAKRVQRDSLDRSLVDLASFYRDVLVVQVGSEVELVNDEARPTVLKVARCSTPELTLRRIEAVLAAREAVDANVAPLLAVEAMTIALR